MKKLTRIQLDEFLKAHASALYTLDLGCANSPYSALFPNRVGLDVVAGRGVDVVADAHTLPFEDSKFEQIVCTEVLEHLHTPERAIEEMSRVLKTGGKLILTTRFLFPIHDAPHDYFRYTSFGLRHLFKAWEIEILKEELDSPDTLAALLQRIMVQSTFRGGVIGKCVCYLLMHKVRLLSFFIHKEYGNTKKEGAPLPIMTTGYYLVCRKR